ncbi:hypothetical protein ACFPME_14110 [Rhodanobacter umsongensis]|uniref:Uncharacterized protein n=1 Tax=Rhodanobacter umsongensis TaxID=633153 RepID=A0ABW0JNQ9_9GAMM
MGGDDGLQRRHVGADCALVVDAPQIRRQVDCVVHRHVCEIGPIILAGRGTPRR